MLKDIGSAIGLGLAQAAAVMVPAFALAGWLSVWMAKQVAASHGPRVDVGRPTQ